MTEKKKRPVGRPRGGTAPEAVRRYWRMLKRKQKEREEKEEEN